MSNPKVELHIKDHGVITLELDAAKMNPELNIGDSFPIASNQAMTLVWKS